MATQVWMTDRGITYPTQKEAEAAEIRDAESANHALALGMYNALEALACPGWLEDWEQTEDMMGVTSLLTAHCAAVRREMTYLQNGVSDAIEMLGGHEWEKRRDACTTDEHLVELLHDLCLSRAGHAAADNLQVLELRRQAYAMFKEGAGVGRYITVDVDGEVWAWSGAPEYAGGGWISPYVSGRLLGKLASRITEDQCRRLLIDTETEAE